MPVWGTAEPDRPITVAFAGQTKTTQANSEGRWTVVLDPLAVSATPQTLSVRDGSSEVALADILVGEVWLVAGRSNIGFAQQRMTDAAAERAKADQPLLRLLRVDTPQPSATPSETFMTKGWQLASPQTVGGFSAIGWVFGSELQRARNVPVGIIASSWGGSRPSQWTAQAPDPAHISGSVTTSVEQVAFERESAQFHRATDGQVSHNQPGDIGQCYNSHIHPLVPIAISGVVVFFDGAPADELKCLAGSWRQTWAREDLPFLFIQTHRQGGPRQEDPNSPSDYGRTSLLPLVRSFPQSALVVALDTGVEGNKDIHPPNKRPVGERAALAARSLAYGETLVSSGPLALAARREGQRVRVIFEHVGGGLVAQGGALEGFAVSEDGRRWQWAEASIEGGEVALTAPLPIKHVRYAYGGDNPRGNLYNTDNLPASPFALAVTP